jgi:hypothetical protein
LVSKQISTKLTKKQASKQTKSDGMDIMEWITKKQKNKQRGDRLQLFLKFLNKSTKNQNNEVCKQKLH